VEKGIMGKVKELFTAYHNGELPQQGGYILSSFFQDTSSYSRYEVTSYNNVKDIYLTSEGDLTFVADGKKLYVLVEPANYPKKHMDPSFRETAFQIPYRFSELETITSKRQDRIMVGKKPVISYSSFTIVKSVGDNFSYIIYNTEDLTDVIEKFFLETIWRHANVPKLDAEKTARLIREVFEDFITVKIE
jgi:hypothetical protein